MPLLSSSLLSRDVNRSTFVWLGAGDGMSFIQAAQCFSRMRKGSPPAAVEWMISQPVSSAPATPMLCMWTAHWMSSHADAMAMVSRRATTERHNVTACIAPTARLTKCHRFLEGQQPQTCITLGLSHLSSPQGNTQTVLRRVAPPIHEKTKHLLSISKHDCKRILDIGCLGDSLPPTFIAGLTILCGGLTGDVQAFASAPGSQTTIVMGRLPYNPLEASSWRVCLNQCHALPILMKFFPENVLIGR